MTFCHVTTVGLPCPSSTRATPARYKQWRACRRLLSMTGDSLHCLFVTACLLIGTIGCEPVISNRSQGGASGGVKVKLKIATCQPTNLPGLGDAIVGVAERVAAMTDGRVELMVHEPGALVPPLEDTDL